MSFIARVLEFERVDRDGVKFAEIKADPGGGANVTGQVFNASGDDAPPLLGDYVVLVPAQRAGGFLIAGHIDTKNAGVAEQGERRIYSRDTDGNVKATVWLKGDGSVIIDNGSGSVELEAGGNVIMNGVTIDTSGNISTEGEVTAGLVPVTLTGHKHTAPSGGGSTSSGIG